MIVQRILIILLVTISMFACNESTKTVQHDKPVSSGDMMIDQINDVLKQTPNKASVYNDRAKRYTELKAYDEAIEDLKTSLKIDSLNPNTYHQLAGVYIDYYQSSKALRTMRDVLDIYPENIPSLLKYVEYQTILQQYDKALITMDKIAKIDPQNGQAAFMLGVIMKETGDIKSAANAFRKATEFDSQITDAWIMLGEIYEKLNDPIAINYYQNAVKTDTNNINAIHSLAYYLQNNDDMDKAIDMYKSIIGKRKSYQPAYLNIGILLMEQKKHKEALSNFRILSTVNPKAHLAYYFMGVCYEELDDIKSAKDNYQNCLNFNPDYKEAQVALDALN